MFTAGLFWLVWVRTLERQTTGRYALIGALAGAAALMRWQDAILLLVPAIDLLWHLRAGRAGDLLLRATACGAGAAAAFVPQMIVWNALYGRPFTVPQGGSFMQWTHPAIWAVLFSSKHGLFTWTPIAALAVAGLALLVRRQRLVGAAALLFFAVSWYVNASVADWWAGEAFGARRFLSCYPIFVLGLAALATRLEFPGRAMAAVATSFAVYTGLLLVQYQAFMHGLRSVVPYPDGIVNLWLWRFRAPIDLVRWWMQR